ncbi:MAG: DUF1599 domain-containing protein [Bacteroidales bacterium]|jgi:hypothetical protein|nr:DUF1599 domain-containing protein [Bacteroidales bacterium]
MDTEKTLPEYAGVMQNCREVFVKKMTDYGAAWRIMRTTSVTDQIFIKARRIRSIEMKGVMKIAEDCRAEYVGIINYCIMGLIQLEHGATDTNTLTCAEIIALYDRYFAQTRDLMCAKNHDYDEAWRTMRISSMTDLILQKLLRIKEIEDNNGQTLISEGIGANYMDIINYAVFALIRLN